MNNKYDFDKIKNRRYIRPGMPEITYRKEVVDGKLCHYIYDHCKKKIYLLDGITPFVWEALDGKNTVDEIVNKLINMYGQEKKNIIISDLCHFLSQIIFLEDD